MLLRKYNEVRRKTVLWPIRTFIINGPGSWNPPLAPYVDLVYEMPQWRDKYEVLWTDDDGDHKRWKPCQHYKRWVTPDPEGLNLYLPLGHNSYTETRRYKTSSPLHGHTLFGMMSSSVVQAFGAFGDHIVGLEALQVEQPDGGFISSPSNLQELVDNSLRAMLPTIKAELSLVNSIIELKDFRSLPRTLQSLSSFTKALPETARNLAKHFSKRNKGTKMERLRKTFSLSTATFAEATRTGADGYLQSEFNIQPLLSDISSIFTAISRHQKGLHDLLRRQGKRRIKHFTVLIQKPLTSMPSQQVTAVMNAGTFQGHYHPPGYTGIYRNVYTTCLCTRSVAEYYSVFHAQVEYNYQFTRFQVENAQLLGMMDALGVNLNPAIIWNAIPWTFIVDWVTNVSKWLNKRKTLNMEPMTNISRYLWSCKTTRRTRVELRPNPNDHFAVPRFHDRYLPDLYEVAYRRDIGIPTGSSLITSGLSLKELSLGAALLLTRNRKFHKRG